MEEEGDARSQVGQGRSGFMFRRKPTSFGQWIFGVRHDGYETDLQSREIVRQTITRRVVEHFAGRYTRIHKFRPSQMLYHTCSESAAEAI